MVLPTIKIFIYFNKKNMTGFIIFFVIYILMIVSLLPINNYLDNNVSDNNKFKIWWKKNIMVTVDDDEEI